MTSMETIASRQSLVDALRRYLVGPYSGEKNERISAGLVDPEKKKKIITQYAHDLYHTGILSPSGTEIDQEESEQEKEESLEVYTDSD